MKLHMKRYGSREQSIQLDLTNKVRHALDAVQQPMCCSSRLTRFRLQAFQGPEGWRSVPAAARCSKQCAGSRHGMPQPAMHSKPPSPSSVSTSGGQLLCGSCGKVRRLLERG